ncbi:MAG: YegS/Rv2252/BmrU family lipid kinase, partial [Clostridia bacterium]|nr:YegS/Rv2252/BmrU family lipid kinase [Clostridia bacterium]
TTFAADFAGEHDLVVCIGGDGTFNEVINGIVTSGAKTPLGYIPAGSTNDFANSLGLSSNIMTAAQNIMDGTPHSIDVGSFGDRYFSYVASFGAFTKASYSTPQNLKNALGHLAYVLEGIKDIPTIHSEHLRFELPDRALEGDYIFGAISNSTSLGGILKINPALVDIGDGLFEMLLIKVPRNADELLRIITALTKQQYDIDMIDFISASSVTVHAGVGLSWSLDGEMAVTDRTTLVSNVHHAISIVV